MAENAERGWRASLPLVIAGFAISFVVVGGGIDTVSVFLNALGKATGWSRSELSLAVSVGAVMAAVSTPLVGMLVDRFGVRVPMTAGVAFLGAGFAVLVSMRESWHFVAANMLLGPGFAACALLPITVAVSVSIRERTALALGIVSAGASAGALTLAPAMQALADAFGWRGAYVALGAGVVLTPIPCLLFALPRGRLPSAARRTDGLIAKSLGGELRQPGVAPLAALMILPGLASFAVSVHLVPYLTGLGHSGAVAATALGATIGISAVGKIGGGLAGDRLGALRMLRFALLTETVAVAALFHAQSVPALLTFVALHGLAMGTQIAVIPPFAVTVLQTDRFATLFGILQLATMLASAVGPVASGVIFDRTGGYGGAVLLWLAAMAGAAAIALAMRITDETRAVPQVEALVTDVQPVPEASNEPVRFR